MSNLYLGSGFRCRTSAGCGFRVMPSSGNDRDLDECARILRAHERTCHWADVVPDLPLIREGNYDDRRTVTALSRAETDASEVVAPVRREPRMPGEARFTCTCKVCGDRFPATGPRAQFCAKESCQARRGRAA